MLDQSELLQGYIRLQCCGFLAIIIIVAGTSAGACSTVKDTYRDIRSTGHRKAHIRHRQCRRIVRPVPNKRHTQSAVGLPTAPSAIALQRLDEPFLVVGLGACQDAVRRNAHSSTDRLRTEHHNGLTVQHRSGRIIVHNSTKTSGTVAYVPARWPFRRR
jgi:hypothetical protein